MLRKIGIYPGTFNPVHAGHIAFALEASQVCGLESVVFLPESVPRKKPDVTPIAGRMLQLEAETAAHDVLEVRQLLSERFTVHETMPELRQVFKDAHLTLLVGSDVLTFMHRWDNLGELMSEVSLAIGLRDHDTPETLKNAIEQLESRHIATVQYDFIRTPHSHISSTQIRDRFAFLTNAASATRDS